MPKANVYNTAGQSTGQVDLPETLFGLKARSHHLWRSVTTHLSNQRLGTVKTKRKGEVSGGGKKPFKQKGTGNARQGSIRAVQFVGGGIAHGPKPRDFSLELPKKMRQQALAESLSDKAQQGKIMVIESIKFDAPKTKQAVGLLKSLGVEGQKCLIIVDQATPATVKSFRNISRAKLLSRSNLNTFEVVTHDVVVMTQGTLKQLTEPSSKSPASKEKAS
ncbi:MAG TPA: 50S ribosomal protein L4 [bacterium]|nr:50S ribosomal protein L4 [bacterium]